MMLLKGIDLTGLLLATFLPWLAGTLLVAAALGRARPSLWLGHGYLVGQLLVIGLLLAWDVLGLSLAFAPIATVLAVIAAIATIATARLWQGLSLPARPAMQARRLWHLLWLLPLAAFLFDRGGVLLAELTLRPLYSWDAWMNWVPRAVVWFHHGALTPFVHPLEWLQAPPGTDVFTLGNWRASEYPPGIPLLLLWQMLGAGTADHTLLYLPWLLLPGSCAMALWGHLRGHGLVPAASALAVFALLSQPLLDIHGVLAGYADLWLAAAFGLGAMALADWQRSGELRYAALSGVMALACTLFKTPGLAFAAILVVAGVGVAWRPPLRLLWWGFGAAGTLLVLGLLLGMLPGFGGEQAALATLDLPGPLPTLHFRLAPLLPHLWESFFVHANWHLLWILVVASLVVGGILRGRVAFENVTLLVFLAALGFLLFVFGFTHYYRQAENGATLNRALLYLVPLAVFLSFQQFAPLLRKSAGSGEAES